jgi:hypothetical protein
MYSLLKALSNRDYLTAARYLAEDDAQTWTPDGLKAAMAPFHAEHEYIRVDHASRAPANTVVLGEGRMLPEFEAALAGRRGARAGLGEVQANHIGAIGHRDVPGHAAAHGAR